jgi:sn-glycerol 3-phosphate transport system ATP-binding protein
LAQVEFRSVSKSFGQTRVIERLNLTIKDGKFTVLVGASGCGKTTLLRMIAGIGPATSGSILMDGRDITSLPPGKRDIAMVFQNYAIYPTMSVRGNIEFGLKNRRVPKAERDRLIEEYASIVGLQSYLNRKPNELSGGQRQRVALARAMVKHPAVFLMDEPLSNLDAKLRAAMRGELIELQRRLSATFVYVTHDQVEAMSMADTIVLMEKGEIRQAGTPEEIYRHPVNLFTAQLIGAPPMNVLPLPGGFSVGVRPEHLDFSAEPPPDAALFLRGAVVTREMLGAETQYRLKAGGRTLMVKSSREEMRVGRETGIRASARDLRFFDPGGNRVEGSEDLYRMVEGMNHE